MNTTNIGVIGLGLIGGSMAMDLKRRINVNVYGYDDNASHLDAAIELGLIDFGGTWNELIDICSIIILAIPVNKIEELLPSLLDRVKVETVIIDVGSTKVDICKSIQHHSRRGRFVPAHPLAGTEFSGPQAALSGLFNGKKNIICETALIDKDALDVSLQIFDSLGLKTSYMSAEDHDKHMAYVSHLSHVSSFMLGLTVLDIEKDENQIFALAGTGFESTVRLAKSNPSTWSAIFSKNKTYLLEALQSYIDHLEHFKQLIADDDIKSLESRMKDSNQIKRILSNKN